MRSADVVDEATLGSFMTEPSDRLIAAARRIDGSVLILGGSGKMGPELAGMMQRANAEVGTAHEVIVASTFSDARTQEQLESAGVRCIRGDLTSGEFLASLPDVALLHGSTRVHLPPSADSPSHHNLHRFRHSKCRHPIDDVDGDQRLPLLGLAVLGSEVISDNAFVSVHPVLGASLAVGA